MLSFWYSGLHDVNMIGASLAPRTVKIDAEGHAADKQCHDIVNLNASTVRTEVHW